MEKIVKDIVDYLRIPEKKEKAGLNRETIRKCNYALSNMAAADRNVALYASYLEEWYRLLAERNPDNYARTQELRSQMQQLEKNKAVREYDFVLSYRHELERQISDYYQTIQKDFRDELISQKLPEIYVSQGIVTFNPQMKMAKHIIIPGTTIAAYEDNFETTIFPVSKPITSAREARHFYNKVSFRYLEQLAEDYSYDLEGKDLGKVKVLRRGK